MYILEHVPTGKRLHFDSSAVANYYAVRVYEYSSGGLYTSRSTTAHLQHPSLRKIPLEELVMYLCQLSI